MLPIKRRVKKESFEKIMKDGVFLHSVNFYIRYFNRKDDLPSRFAFIVPAKVMKTSVGRHLIKRMMTAGVEKKLPAIKQGVSCIFFIKKDISAFSTSEIGKEIVAILEKAKLLNGN